MNATDKAAPTLANIPIGDLAKHCQDPTMLATVVSLAYNQGYKLGQEQAHRYYSMMLAGQGVASTGGESVNGMPGISHEWEDKGYWSELDPIDEAVILVGWKDKPFAAYPRHAATREILNGFCERHDARLVEATEAV